MSLGLTKLGSKSAQKSCSMLLQYPSKPCSMLLEYSSKPCMSRPTLQHAINPSKPCMSRPTLQHAFNPSKPCCSTFHHAYSIPLSSSYKFIEWPPPNFPSCFMHVITWQRWPCILQLGIKVANTSCILPPIIYCLPPTISSALTSCRPLSKNSLGSFIHCRPPLHHCLHHAAHPCIMAYLIAAHFQYGCMDAAQQ